MKINFQKFHGTGNDFILFDFRKDISPFNENHIAELCHRRFGIGADGIMFLLPSDDLSFEMKYFNADGKEGSMCGNGGRCIAAFAHDLGFTAQTSEFRAIDGNHMAVVKPISKNTYDVEIGLNDINDINQFKDGFFTLNTGSPHYVEFVENLEAIDVFKLGKQIRWDQRFQPDGINVNFVQRLNDRLLIKTFERGVENITLSCGTGVTASAIASTYNENDGEYIWPISTDGGDLMVMFNKSNSSFRNIKLKGAATKVFEGVINI